MERIAFKMKLLKGCAVEYQKRHDEIWPDLVKLFKKMGIKDYSIFFDDETHTLFATLKAPGTNDLEVLPSLDVVKRWWVYISDIMVTNSDNSPVTIPLKEVFHLD
jgi:L-rhamnose mutarotase